VIGFPSELLIAFSGILNYGHIIKHGIETRLDMLPAPSY
jgi:hypothetical protein